MDYKITDPKGLPLDTAGITTPGAVSVSFLCAYIPKGQTQFYSYATRTQTSPITKVTAIQAGADSGGTTKQVADGEFLYTFKTKAAGAKTRLGIRPHPSCGHLRFAQPDRVRPGHQLRFRHDDLDSGRWVPTNTRDVMRTASCNKCHDSLAFHGGSRVGMDLCIMCHTPQTVDPDTGNTVDMKVFVHKLHMGSQLPSVLAGKPYQIIGFNQARIRLVNGEFAFRPAALRILPRRSTKVRERHRPITGSTIPSRAACGSCHDNVNFATGKNHVNLPQVSDNQCTQCHIPQGELEFDASIKGAHTIPTESATRPGLVAQHP